MTIYVVQGGRYEIRIENGIEITNYISTYEPSL